MYLDAELRLWNSVALTTSADSTNAVDMGAAGRDYSRGEPMCIVINVEVAALVVGTETYEFNFVQSASADLSSDDELCSIAFTTTQASTRLTAGKIIVLPIPPGSLTKRYIGAAYVSANTAGITISANIQPMSMLQMDALYADNITIS